MKAVARRFTLIEGVVVFFIVVILAAMLIPALIKAREKVRQTQTQQYKRAEETKKLENEYYEVVLLDDQFEPVHTERVKGSKIGVEEGCVIIWKGSNPLEVIHWPHAFEIRKD